MNLKQRGTTLALSGIIVVSTAVGAAGGVMLSGLGAHAQTPSATPSTAPATTAPSGTNGAGQGQGAPSGANGAAPGSVNPSGPGGRGPGAMGSAGPFKSNEDPAHEATESAEREAQEDAGQRPTVR